MSRVTIRVQIESKVQGYNWPRLSSLIEDALASTVSHNQYEFYRYGDAVDFQITCDEMGIKYSVWDLSID